MLAAGLGEFSLHSLRHTHASTLLRNGENIRAVSKRLGHSDPAFTLRVYSWAMPAEDARLANSIELALAA
jgi:integrase